MSYQPQCICCHDSMHELANEIYIDQELGGRVCRECAYHLTIVELLLKKAKIWPCSGPLRT